jgi:hypothetical protein
MVFHQSHSHLFCPRFCLHKQAVAQRSLDKADFAPFKADKEEFMNRRAEAIGFKRGIEKDKPFDPAKRIIAVQQMEEQKMQRSSRRGSYQRNILAPWLEIGPNPIPNGQVVSGPQLPVSGRTISIAVHPTNPDILYVGTAQGGLYRSLNGGTTWVPLMDNALSLAINTVAIAASQPNTIFVGTGEANFSSDSYFGAGIYRIDNANSATPTITGPIGSSVFTGRAVSKIVVHPTDPNIIFAGSASGIGGIGAASNSSLANRGLFRSTNALSASPTFTQLTLTGLAAQTRNIVDMVMDPGNPDRVLCTVGDSFNAGEGGVYLSTNALAAIPSFVRTFTAGIGTSASRTELALHRSGGGVVTVYAASGFNGGTVQRSIDGGATWTQRIDNNFCGGQCFYDIAVEVDPTNADRVYLGGVGTNTTFTISNNGGTTFTSSESGLHTDSHVITVAPSLATTIYFGSDGGIYKSTDAGITWASLNNTTFRATQFMSLALHPTDPNYTIGGTQDNGTNMYKPDGSWNRIDYGDGGYAAIDQNATDVTNVQMYHTYFNQTNAMGYARVTTTAAATEGNWAFFGCGFLGSTPNGMTCTATAILFYAPMETGPGNPNTLYFGSDVLYRSTDGGTSVTKVSQEPISSGVAISAIGISPQNDNVRVVGLRTGGIFGTTTGSSTLINLDAANTVPNGFIARIAIDPNNVNTAYVTLSSFGFVSVWKTTNLNDANPTWTAAATGIPNVPVNAFAIDASNSNNLYAGTDIGVYISEDAGASWVPFGTGLPIVAVFDMAIHPVTKVLRIATHGRGLWEIPTGDIVCNVSGSGTTTPVSCNGNTDGTATITLAGDGSGAPGTYTLDGGGPQAFATNPFTITNLSAGNHTIVATVTAGACVSGDIVVNVANAVTFTATVEKTNVSACNAVNDGTITVTPAGGSGNYTYSWTGSTGLGNANQTPFTAGNVSSLTGLTYGFYNVTITDAGGCGTLTINNIHVGFAFVVIVTNNGSISSSCGIPAGSISLYGNAGVQPYTFSIDGINYQAGNTFTGLAAGTYTGYVKDATGCVGTKPNIVIGTAAPLVVIPFTKAASSCGSDGTIEIYRSGGIGPYTYSLDNITYQSGNIFTNQAAGNYTAYVKDSKGCISSAPATVAQGASLAVTAVTTSSSICIADGTIRLNATGGNSPYTYSLDNITYQPGNAFTGLVAGNYIGYVKDFKGCTGQVNVIIGSNTINVTSFAIAASGCAASNGSIQLFRTGGTGPYTYSLDGNTYQSSPLFTGLTAGTYDGYVKDSKACIGVQNGIVVGPTDCAPPFAGTAGRSANNILVPENPGQRVQVYPNPSQSEFTLMLSGYKHSENVSVTVTDVLGRKIYQTSGKGKLLYKFGNDFNTGVYNVEVIQGNEKNSIKIVKK